ncbi:MAG TPA: hypothetical protein VJ784_19280 [Pyrinomonadaceae bacterium]|nr:hypothetical protein [Pyrinomonadaceae bacterium]
MTKCGHYDKWREDFKLVEELGIRFLRYGPSYYRTHIGLMRIPASSSAIV